MTDTNKINEEIIDDNLDSEEIKEELVDNDLNESCDENPQDKTDKDFEDLKDNFVRLQADFINFKRRTEQERSDYIELGSIKVLNNILLVVDNFERALESQTQDENYKNGIELIYKQIIDLLGKFDVVEMEAENKDFDPNLHHAVMVEEKDGVKEGIVLEVLQKGYMIGKKVLRPAMVKVSK
ncbi:nucleotide exchange factor GrpE [Peptoniphilus catoniae]|uniref:nucleotide exchange factor GrpE n=1 Tax=Peptoniphilus catoniae TaxID=1660341 RepID=UPI0010FD709A|nr:nucleotide exchange factor GrpE [Peptoniphilus catoniae]